VFIYHFDTMLFYAGIQSSLFDRAGKERFAFVKRIFIFKLRVALAALRLDATVTPAKNEEIDIELIYPLLDYFHLGLISRRKQFHAGRNMSGREDGFNRSLPFLTQIAEGRRNEDLQTLSDEIDHNSSKLAGFCILR